MSSHITRHPIPRIRLTHRRQLPSRIIMTSHRSPLLRHRIPPPNSISSSLTSIRTLTPHKQSKPVTKEPEHVLLLHLIPLLNSPRNNLPSKRLPSRKIVTTLIRERLIHQ